MSSVLHRKNGIERSWSTCRHTQYGVGADITFRTRDRRYGNARCYLADCRCSSSICSTCIRGEWLRVVRPERWAPQPTVKPAHLPLAGGRFHLMSSSQLLTHSEK